MERLTSYICSGIIGLSRAPVIKFGSIQSLDSIDELIVEENVEQIDDYRFSHQMFNSTLHCRVLDCSEALIGGYFFQLSHQSEGNVQSASLSLCRLSKRQHAAPDVVWSEVMPSDAFILRCKMNESGSEALTICSAINSVFRLYRCQFLATYEFVQARELLLSASAQQLFADLVVDQVMQTCPSI